MSEPCQDLFGSPLIQTLSLPKRVGPFSGLIRLVL